MCPVFDYSCGACNHAWEITVLSSAGQKEPDPECPHCSNKTSVRRLVGGSGVSFRLYGSGFHKRTHKDTGDFGG